MDVIHQRCAGLDISKRDAKVCIRTPGPRPGTYIKTVRTYPAMFADITRLREDLVAAGVTMVVMEATGDYWKPFYYQFEGVVDQMLVNARHAKNLPGRKTDVSDSQWLAELGAHGLVKPSFVPAWPIRELRDLTRQRALLVGEHSREIQRLEKFLESTGIKYSSVSSRVTGVSGIAILEALIRGERDPATLAGLAKGRLRDKIPELTRALDGRFTDHHAHLTRLHLDRITHLAAQITAWDQLIAQHLDQHGLQWAVDLLATMPGVSTTGATTIIAETGVDMTCFPTAAQFASWAGVCPGQHESAGKTRPVHARPGNAHLKGALGIAAMSAIRANGSFLQDRYHRIKSRRGPMCALIAVEHTMITAIWHMLTTGQPYRDLGADHHTLTHHRSKDRAVEDLQHLGYTVTLTTN